MMSGANMETSVAADVDEGELHEEGDVEEEDVDDGEVDEEEMEVIETEELLPPDQFGLAKLSAGPNNFSEVSLLYRRMHS